MNDRPEVIAIANWLIAKEVEDAPRRLVAHDEAVRSMRNLHEQTVEERRDTRERGVSLADFKFQCRWDIDRRYR